MVQARDVFLVWEGELVLAGGPGWLWDLGSCQHMGGAGWEPQGRELIWGLRTGTGRSKRLRRQEGNQRSGPSPAVRLEGRGRGSK